MRSLRAERPTHDPYPQKLLSAPPVSLRLRARPWWFPIQELSNSLVLYMEAWVAERIIGELLTPGIWVNSLCSARGSKSIYALQSSLPCKAHAYPSEAILLPKRLFLTCLGPDQAEISEIEWLSQALLRVDSADSGNLAEITIFGRPSAQIRMKNILLNMAAWHKENEVQRAKKMKQVEEFLKVRASSTVSNPSIKEQIRPKLAGSPLPLE